MNRRDAVLVYSSLSETAAEKTLRDETHVDRALLFSLRAAITCWHALDELLVSLQDVVAAAPSLPSPLRA